MQRSLGRIFALILLLAPASAFAQEGEGQGEGEEEAGASAMRTEGLDDEEARSRFRIGQALYMEGRFLEAAEEFESSYRLSGRRSLLYNAYLSYRDAGQLADAVRTLELYLEGDTDQEDAEQLQQRLAAMRATLAEEQAAEAEREAERQRLAEERAEAERRAEEAARREAEQRRRAEEAEEGLNPIGWIVGGAGLALVAGGAVAGILASSARGDLEESCPDDRCVVGFDLASERKSVERPRLAADVLLFAGGATVIAGLVVLFVGRGGSSDDDDTEAQTTGGLTCGPGGCMGTLRTSF
jgi:tetratricopeptide (TPR) repeat protein